MIEHIIFPKKLNIPDDYEVIYSHRKTLAIQIKPLWRVIIRAPFYTKNIFIENFVNSKKDWILQKRKLIFEKSQFFENLSESEIKNMKIRLKNYIIPRVFEIWKETNLPKYTSIKITKSEHRWGSCSGKNGLCFSFRLAKFLDIDTKIIDAVIVHELAHLREKNHQKPFWNLVYSLMSDYEIFHKKLSQ